MEAYAVMIIIRENGNSIQIPDEAVCISHGANTLGKGMNPSILYPAMGK